MKFETLIIAVDQEDHSLIERANIQTDTVVGNQGKYSKTETFQFRGVTVKYCHSTDRGIGKNRNLVLNHAQGEICILADDDMVFVDGYPAVVEKAVSMVPDADIWIFNLIEKVPGRFAFKKLTDIGYRNYGKFGAARIVVRRESIQKNKIRFSELFGGGAVYGSGEDTLFLKECLDKKLKIVGVPLALAEIDQTAESTWFRGYTEKFFFDKGAAYRALYGKLAPALMGRYVVKCKYKKCNTLHMFQALRTMMWGMKDYDRRIKEK